MIDIIFFRPYSHNKYHIFCKIFNSIKLEFYVEQSIKHLLHCIFYERTNGMTLYTYIKETRKNKKYSSMWVIELCKKIQKKIQKDMYIKHLMRQEINLFLTNRKSS